MLPRLITAIGLVLLLSGCWDRLEVNDLGIVTLIGLDKTEDGVEVSINLAVPAKSGGSVGGGESSNPSASGSKLTYTATGPSVAAAVGRLQSRASRRLFWGHTRVLVIGADLARTGVSDALDFWTRHPEPRLLMDVVVTPESAVEFLKAQPRLERLLAEAVREGVTMNNYNHVTLKDFALALRSAPAQAVAPRVQLASGPGGGRDVQVSGAAVFREDRLAGFLDGDTARGLMWLRGQMATGMLTAKVPDLGPIGIDVTRSRTSSRAEFVNGKLRLNVRVGAEGDLVEDPGGADLTKPEALGRLNAAAATAVRTRMEQALQRLQTDFRADAARMGEAVHQSVPLAWEQYYRRRWLDLFPEVPVAISVDFQIRRAGGHTAPLTKAVK